MDAIHQQEREVAAGRLPQLAMRRDLRACGSGTLPPLCVPEAYALRRFQEGDEFAWMAVLNSTGSLGVWDRQRVETVLSRGIARERIWLLWREEEPVATACVCLWERARPQSEIGWVAVAPAHQGRGLGALLTLAACYGARDLGYNEVFLLTDDFRLPALKTYLRLGFQPDCWHESHARRWEAVRQALQS